MFSGFFQNAALKVRGLPEVFSRSSRVLPEVFLDVIQFFPSQCPPLCGLLANSFERVSLKPAALRDVDAIAGREEELRHRAGRLHVNAVLGQQQRVAGRRDIRHKSVLVRRVDEPQAHPRTVRHRDLGSE